MKKYFPEIGDGLYLAQRGRSYGPAADVKRPYTVVMVKQNMVLIQKDECIFDPNDNYFDSMPREIRRNPQGELVTLHWSDTIEGGCWWAYKDSTGRDYPMVAYFGAHEYYPYID